MQNEEQNPKGMIITDDFAENPVLDFNAYAETIVEIIRTSNPNFTIGIYGEWGTGKTTLMRNIESRLKSDKTVTTVWFNAWRYEREEQFTLIPLLKKIAYSLPAEDQYNGLRNSIKKGLGTIRKNWGQIVTSVVSDFVRKSVGSDTADVVNDISNKLIPKIELLTEVNEKDTIYFDGLDKIEEEIRKIRVKGHPVRIVVFIDDLDRCSPKKALEVFESVKVFLGVDGFIYILGLSHETISKLITAEYGKSDIKGDQYIKKIIQIPISLPEWTSGDVSILIDDFMTSGLIPEKYLDIIKKNKDLVAKAIENNPRETKRFINNFIVAHEILLRYVQKVNAKELLLVQAINVRWNRFFRILVKLDDISRRELELYVGMSEEERSRELDEGIIPQPDNTIRGSAKKFNINLKRLLHEFKTDFELWNFLSGNSEEIFGIKNWEIYRRGAQAVSEISSEENLSERTKSEWTAELLRETSLFTPSLNELEKVGIHLNKRLVDELNETLAGAYVRERRDQRGFRIYDYIPFDDIIRILEELRMQIGLASRKVNNSSLSEELVKNLIIRIEVLLKEWHTLKP